MLLRVYAITRLVTLIGSIIITQLLLAYEPPRQAHVAPATFLKS